VLHFSWNRSLSQACWFHEKWNTVALPKRRWRELVRKLCSTFHGTNMPANWFHEKWNTVVCPKRRWRELTPKPCSTFHGTKALRRHVGSMKSGTRFSQACWSHEKWNTVVHPKRSWRGIVRKLCCIFQGTQALPRHAKDKDTRSMYCAWLQPGCMP